MVRSTPCGEEERTGETTLILSFYCLRWTRCVGLARRQRGVGVGRYWGRRGHRLEASCNVADSRACQRERKIASQEYRSLAADFGAEFRIEDPSCLLLLCGGAVNKRVIKHFILP